VAASKQVRSSTPRSPLFTRAFTLLLLVQFSYGTAFSTFFALPKYLLEVLAAPSTLVGNAHGAFALAGALAVPFVGAAIDRIGRKRVWLLGIMVGVATFAPFGWVSSHSGVLALRALHGLSFSMVFASGGAMVIDLAPDSRRAEAVGYFGTAMLATNAIGPTTAEWIADTHGWSAVFLGCSGYAALALVAATLFVAPPFTRNTGSLMRFPFSMPLSGAYLAALALGVGVGSSKTFVPAAMVEEGATRIAPYFLGFVAGALFQRTALGWLPDRLGRLRATTLSLWGYGLVLFLFVPVPAAWVGMISPLLGMAHGAAYPASAALTMDLCDMASRGRATAWAAGFFNLGLALSSSGLAPLEPWLSYRGLVACGGVFVIASAVIVPRLVATPRVARELREPGPSLTQSPPRL
jgi:MFS family permease